MGYKPKKQLGQNFLSDKGVLMRIIDAAKISKDDIILEIGPGQGSMTHHLALRAKKVFAVEKDYELIQYLRDKFSNQENLEIVNEDILDFLESRSMNNKLKDGGYKIVANIPYYLTSFLLRRIFEIENKPSEIILMVQKEVAERIVAGKGNMNMLAVSVQAFSKPEILFDVGKKSFWPIPKVDSAVIKISSLNSQILGLDTKKFFDLVRSGFSAKRKLLASNLSKGLGIEKENIYDIFKTININKNVRAQDLGVKEWMRVFKIIYEKEK